MQTNPAFCCIQETHFNNKDRHYLRVKGWKNVFQENGPRKQAGVAILMHDIDTETDTMINGIELKTHK
jgi:exonuclease III